MWHHSATENDFPVSKLLSKYPSVPPNKYITRLSRRIESFPFLQEKQNLNIPRFDTVVGRDETKRDICNEKSVCCNIILY